MEIEPIYIRNNVLCQSSLGRMRMRYKNKGKWETFCLDTNSAVKLHHNSKTNTYSLFVVDYAETKEKKLCENTYIGLDPGIRTFMTGISHDDAVEIGTNLGGKIKDIVNKIEKTDASNKEKKIKIKINANRYK